MANKFTKEQIFEELKNILHEELEVEEDLIKGEANLFEDLELDSIDAVDIAVRMQRFTDKKLSPEEFKQIKTVDDVVNAVLALLNKDEEKIQGIFACNLHDIHNLYFPLHTLDCGEVLSGSCEFFNFFNVFYIIVSKRNCYTKNRENNGT